MLNRYYQSNIFILISAYFYITLYVLYTKILVSTIRNQAQNIPVPTP
jgi:hypothetical protein